jgi:hypothetical protein
MSMQLLGQFHQLPPWQLWIWVQQGRLLVELEEAEEVWVEDGEEVHLALVRTWAEAGAVVIKTLI